MKANFLTLFLILFFLFGLLNLSFASLNSSGEDDDISDDDFDSLEQEKSNENEVEFKLKSSKAKIKKEFKFRLRTEDGSGLEFKVEGSSQDSSVEIENKFEIKFDKIITYTPSGDLGYQIGDTIVSELKFEDMTWNPIQCSETNGTYKCSASTTDGFFSTIIYLVTASKTEGGISYIPTSIKFDTIIKKDTAASVALVLKLESKEVSESVSEGEDENEDDDKEVILDKGAGVFRFLPTFNIEDGSGNITETLNVIHGTLDTSSATNDEGVEDDEESAKSITFSFETSKTGYAVWDPWFGNGPIGLKQTGSASFLAANFFLVLLGVLLV